MKAYIQGRRGIPGSVSAYDAYLGFYDMGFEVEVFDDAAILKEVSREDVVVGGIGIVRPHLESLGALCPSVDYPEELGPFLGRKLWRTTINHVNSEVGSWPVFVKPVEEKRFTGCVVRSTADLVGKGCQDDDFEGHLQRVNQNVVGISLLRASRGNSRRASLSGRLGPRAEQERC